MGCGSADIDQLVSCPLCELADWCLAGWVSRLSRLDQAGRSGQGDDLSNVPFFVPIRFALGGLELRGRCE